MNVPGDRPLVASQSSPDIESYIEAYEDACARGLPAPESLCTFVPQERDGELYRSTVVELVRVDMERRWNDLPLDAISFYRFLFPDVLRDVESLEAIRFEWNRLKKSGQNESDPAALDSRECRKIQTIVTDQMQSFHSLLNRFPQVGDRFGEFELSQCIGVGAFGRVYTALQLELAQREVVLKITPATSIEAEQLARLQHTNIVPIYSIHRLDDLQAICMPYLGRSTLQELASTSSEGTLKRTSGQDLISTLHQQRDKTELDTSQSIPNIQSLEIARTAERGTASGQSPASRKWNHAEIPYAPLNYADSIAWIGCRIAEGLAHAHQRGVLHLDVKPANILIGDDGIPRLLDFHVAATYDASQAATAVQGGTLPYMSAEHARAFVSRGPVDARADIFSLGVVLYQLLSGQLPFPQPTSGTLEQMFPEMLEARNHKPPLAPLHPQSSMGLQSIIKRCIAPYAYRYPTMDQVVEDLQRHLDHLPLRFAPNLSLPERFTKFCKRHPRVTSMTSMTLVCGLIVASFGFAWWNQSTKAARSQAVVIADRLDRELDRKRVQWIATTTQSVPVEDRDLSQGWFESDGEATAPPPTIERVQQWLDRLPPARAIDAKVRLSEYAFLQRSLHERSTATEPSKRQPDMDRWRTIFDAMQKQLSEHGGLSSVSHSLMAHPIRLSLYEQIESAKFRSLVADPQSKLAESIDRLEALERSDRSLFLMRAALGAARQRWRDAETYYATYIELQPNVPETYFLRGLARLDGDRNLEALADFKAYLESHSNHIPTLVNAAIACQKLGLDDQAVTYLDEVIAVVPDHLKGLVLRSRSRRALRDAQGSAEDRQAALAATPRTVQEWVLRGVERMASDVPGALKDFAMAHELDPSHLGAIQNTANLYTERLNQVDEGVRWMDLAVEAEPNNATTIVSRGVLLARMGNDQGADRDAARALGLSDAALTHYQVACIDSLLLSQQPERLTRGTRELSLAVLKDPSLARLAPTDSDMRNLLVDEDVRRILGAVQFVTTASIKQVDAPKLNSSSPPATPTTAGDRP